MADFPRFSQLSPDSRPWRIDWFGEVGYPGSVRQYRQPCIRVAISPLLDPPDSLSFCETFRTDIQYQRNIWMPIGSLAMLRIGDIWQNGQLLTSPLYSQTLFSNLKIAPDTTTWIKAGIAVDSHYILPFEAHPWHRLHTQTYCLAVKANDDVTLIIPGAELVRFYFGSSSTLLKRLVTGPLDEETLWREKHLDADKGHLHLKLADGLSGMSASDIGRIAGDPHAWKAAANIYGNCLKATSQGEAAYLHTDFPFKGETSLMAVGIWLPFGDTPRSNFLVFNLRSCDHPFPFASLTYDVGDRQVRKRNHSDTISDGKTTRRSSGSKEGSTLETSDPGIGKGTRRFAFDHSVRFPDLRRKPVWREQIAALGPVDVMLRYADGSAEQVAFGEREGSGKARAIDGCLGEPQAETMESVPPKLPHFARLGIAIALSALAGRNQNIVAKPLLPFGATDPVFSLPMVVDEDGVVDVSVLYTEPNGTHRPRHACLIALIRDAEELKRLAVIEGTRIGESPQIVDAAGFTGSELDYRCQLVRQIIGYSRSKCQ